VNASAAGRANQRAAFLLKASDVLAEHADELALLQSRENGKPVADARSNDINFLIGVFRFFGSLVEKLPTDFYDKGAIFTSTYLEPVHERFRNAHAKPFRCSGQG
jgi:acyl-CoA reductase-like NAD-dependent aldehyde dehydrogenase